MTKPLVAGDYDPPQGVDVYCLSMLGMESRDLHACRLKSWHARSSVTRSRAYGFEIMSTEELTKKWECWLDAGETYPELAAAILMIGDGKIEDF